MRFFEARFSFISPTGAEVIFDNCGICSTFAARNIIKHLYKKNRN